MTFTTALAAVLVLVLIPVVLVWRLTETKQQTVRRLRRRGFTWQQVADRFNVHPSTCRRWAKA